MKNVKKGAKTSVESVKKKKQKKLKWPPKNAWNICYKCARKYGARLPKEWCGTVTYGPCVDCGRESTLIPAVDYVSPDGKMPVWD